MATRPLKGWTDFDAGVADKIVELRSDFRLTQKELGAKIGRHQTEVGAWETGCRRVKFEDAVLLCEAFGLDVRELVP